MPSFLPDASAVSFKSLTACCTDATCRQCRTVLRFFVIGKDLLYGAIVPYGVGVPNGSSEVPRSLRPFSNSTGKLDDGDIKLMFSAKVEPVVGSYRDADAFPDGMVIEGSVFGARSC
jgi:hypothetical protein